MRLHAQAAQHAGPGQSQVVPLQQQQQQQHGLAWPPQGQQQAWQQQWTGQQQQQQQHSRDALQPLSVNQQQQAAAVAQADNSGSGRQALPGAVPLQTSISGFVTRQPRQQQQQQGDAKEQWRALFRQPKQPLGSHNPAQQGSGEVRQARIGTQGQVVRPPPPPTPAAAAAMAPQPALPQAAGPSLPRSVWLLLCRMGC
jgi:hypothetical protein